VRNKYTDLALTSCWHDRRVSDGKSVIVQC
jgi:hypothetical protein